MPIEYAVIISITTVACTIIGVVIGFSRLRHAQRAEDRENGKVLAALRTTLDHVDKGVCGLTSDMREMRVDMKSQFERLIIVEEVAKAAHKRIDELKGK